MPAALERKLEKEADDKGLSKKRKDAYVYGTLRKTGWKPSREKKMSNASKLVRLSEIDQNLDSIIQFDYGDPNGNKRSLLGTTGLVGAGAAAGVGGTLAHQAIQNTGGYGANALAGKMAYQYGKKFTKEIGGSVASGPGTQIGMALKKLKAMLPAWRGLSSKQDVIQFDSDRDEDDKRKEPILEPPSEGAVPNSKIIQEQFPAGLSPAAVLKFPFPKLMAYLKQKNILQQQFSKRVRLIQLNARINSIVDVQRSRHDQNRQA